MIRTTKVKASSNPEQRRILIAAIDQEISGLAISYNRGYSAFKRGERKDYITSQLETRSLNNRLTFLNNNQIKKADAIALKFLLQGICLIDVMSNEFEDKVEYTIAEQIIEASNPYNAGSMLSKEWQRGNNSAYFDNLKRVKVNEAHRRNNH